MVQLTGSGIDGWTNVALVTDSHELLITGSVTSNLSVDVGSESFIPAGSVIITNRIAGSIVDLPPVLQGTSPWIINGSVRVIQNDIDRTIAAGSVIITENVNVTQGISPWVIAGSISSIPTVSVIFGPHTGSGILIGGNHNGSLYPIALDSSNRLLISNEPITPAATTAVSVIEFDSVSAISDNYYSIPVGSFLVLQRFSAGAETDTTAGNVVELKISGIASQFLDVIFCGGNSFQHDFDEQIGGGSVIQLSRRRLGGGAKEIFGRWEGYVGE